VNELLEHIESLKKAFAKLQPLTPENQQRLDKKFRLEWNYNSNHIEGNTLTYGETELLLIFEKTKGNHDKREYDEMQGHDVALKLVSDLAVNSERTITEKFIRELNQVILVKPFYKEAITPDGQPTRRLIKIGDYKSFPNSVRLQNGEIFNYPSPAETPALMGDLVAWYLQISIDKEVSPIEIAAELHYKFVCIHPFDDGNGRIARLLMNYHLLKNGFPPVIIKTSDKKNYLFGLHEADTGNIEAFKKYIAEQLIWSYEISNKAAKGENIEEIGDWEKKIKLLNQKLDPSLTIEKRRSSKVIAETLNDAILPFIDLLLVKWSGINDMFLNHSVKIQIQNYGGTNFLSDPNQFKAFFDGVENVDKPIDGATLTYFLDGFKKNGIYSFRLEIPITLFFTEFYYSIALNPLTFAEIKKPYHEKLSEQEEEQIANAITEYIIAAIEQQRLSPK